MQADIGDIHVFLDEKDRPKVIHQQGHIMLNFSLYDFRDNRNLLDKLTIQFKDLDQVKMTIESLQDLLNILNRLEKDDDCSIEILFDNENCRRYKF